MDELGSVSDEEIRTDCLRCGGELRHRGVFRFRTGGESGGMTVIFSLVQLSEALVALHVLVCVRCRQVEFVAVETEAQGPRPGWPRLG